MDSSMCTPTNPNPRPMYNLTGESVAATGDEPAGRGSRFSEARLSQADDPTTVEAMDGFKADLSCSRQRVRRVLVPQQQELMDERRKLVLRRFERRELSRQEQLQLGLLEWKLNLIDDAVMAPELDQQAKFLRLKRELAQDLDAFVQQMQLARPTVPAARGKRHQR